MSYTPTTWVTGDTITAVKLNNMEQGIVNSVALVVTTTWNNEKNGYEIDKTPAQIASACADGRTCILAGELGGTIYAEEAPFGGLYIVDVSSEVDVQTEATPPILSYTIHDWDSENSVITSETYAYSLTPAT